MHDEEQDYPRCYNLGPCSRSAPLRSCSWAPSGSWLPATAKLPSRPSTPTADITDLWAFRSYDADGNDTNPASITMIMAVNPFEEPANGPNWFPFDPRDPLCNSHRQQPGRPGRHRFSISLLDPVPIADRSHGPGGIHLGSGGTRPGVPPQITDFANPGLNLRQTYTVTMIKNGVATPIMNQRWLAVLRGSRQRRSAHHELCGSVCRGYLHQHQQGHFGIFRHRGRSFLYRPGRSV